MADSIGTEEDQVSFKKRRSRTHHYRVPTRFGYVPRDIAPELGRAEDGGYVGDYIKVEWDLCGWSTPFGPMIGFTSGVFSCEKHPGGEWLCPMGNRHRIDRHTNASIIMGEYPTGQSIPLTLRGYGALSAPPPFCPALQACLYVGQCTSPDLFVLPTVFNMSPVSEGSRRWLESADTRIQDAFDKGVGTIFLQTGVSMLGSVAEVTPEQVVALMKQFGIALPSGESEASYIEHLQRTLDSTVEQGMRGYVPLSSAEGLPARTPARKAHVASGNPDSFALPEMPVFTERGPVTAASIGLMPLGSVVIPRQDALQYVSWEDASAAINDHMRRIHRATMTCGGILTLVRLDAVVQSTDWHLWRKPDGPDIQATGRLRDDSVVFVSGTGDIVRERFLNGEALRLLHCGARFPKGAPSLLPYISSSSHDRLGTVQDWQSVGKLVFFDDRFGAPFLQGDNIYAHSAYATMRPGDVLTLIFEQEQFPFEPGDRSSPGSVFFRPKPRAVHSDKWLKEVRYPSATQYDDVVAIDPREVEMRDDGYRITRDPYGGSYLLDVFCLSPASHANLMSVISSLAVRSAYSDESVTTMLPEMGIGLSLTRPSYAHHFQFRITSLEVAGQYMGVTTVRLGKALTYHEAFLLRDRNFIRYLLDVSKILRAHRTGLNSNILLHAERSSVTGLPGLPTMNPVHEGIQEIMIQTNIFAAKLVPIRIQTRAQSRGGQAYLRALESRVSAIYGEGWRVDPGTLPIGWRCALRSAYIRNGGAKLYSGGEGPHAHIDQTLSYAHITTSGRNKSSLLNDMYLCRQIDASLAVSFLDQLNDAIPRERIEKKAEEKSRVVSHLPNNPYAVVDVGEGHGVTLFSLPRLAEIRIPEDAVEHGRGFARIRFTVRGDPTYVQVGLADIVYLKARVADMMVVEIDFVLKLHDARNS